MRNVASVDDVRFGFAEALFADVKHSSPVRSQIAMSDPDEEGI